MGMVGVVYSIMLPETILLCKGLFALLSLFMGYIVFQTIVRIIACLQNKDAFNKS
jgi:hypothetical protein